jgi:hypothetical protein
VKRGSLFVGTRPTSKPAAAPAPEPAPSIVEIAALAPRPDVAVAERQGTIYVPSETAAFEPAIAEAASPTVAAPPESESPRAEAIAATEAMPWLFADPGASRPVGGDPAANESPETIEVPGEDAPPEQAAHALSGLPYFDQSGAAHRAEEVPDTKRSSGKVHRVDFDVAGVFESIAARLRSGEIDGSDVDPANGEAAVVAAVLATLLRQRAR